MLTPCEGLGVTQTDRVTEIQQVDKMVALYDPS